MEVGQTASITRMFTQDDVLSFGKLSMDENPIHYNSEYAAATPFGKCIVQGPLVGSLIGGVLGTKLPGPGSVYINQNTKFLKPAFVNDLLTAYVSVQSIRSDKPIVILKTWVENDRGEIIINGEAVIKLM